MKLAQAELGLRLAPEPAIIEAVKDFPRVEVHGRSEWRAWLAAHHAQAQSIWLVTYKKSDPKRYLTYDDIVDEAVCFGWIDSLVRSLDERRSMRLLSPRKPGSGWSAVNKARVERLAAAGLLAPPGIAKIEQAKADGSWTRLDEVEALTLPPDLKEALAAKPPGLSRFEQLPRSTKRMLLERILHAKRPETRAKRIEEVVRQAIDSRSGQVKG